MASPVVLLHAFPLSSRMFEPLRGALPALDVITPDYAPSSDLDALADDVAALLDERGIERAIIGGVSMGGYLAMAFLRRHRARAAAVVLADTKAGADARGCAAPAGHAFDTSPGDTHSPGRDEASRAGHGGEHPQARAGAAGDSPGVG